MTEKCAFCSDRAFARCEVPVTGPAMEEVGRLAPGDLLQSPRTLEFIAIRKIVDSKANESLDTTDCESDVWPAPVRVEAQIGKRKEVHLLTPTLPVIILQTWPCGVPVCESHAIDRGDGRPICPHHWEIVQVEPEGKKTA